MLSNLKSNVTTVSATPATGNDDRLPEEFVQYYAATLATCVTPRDLVNCLIDMVEPSTVEYIERNADRLYLLGSLWLNAIDRMIFAKGNAQFPYELLVLPPLFFQMGWRYDLQGDWQKIRNVFVVLPTDTTLSSEELEQAIVVGTFLDGLFSTPATAMKKMAVDYAGFCQQPNFSQTLVTVASLLGHFGWYAGNTQGQE